MKGKGERRKRGDVHASGGNLPSPTVIPEGERSCSLSNLNLAESRIALGSSG